MENGTPFTGSFVSFLLYIFVNHETHHGSRDLSWYV